MSGNYDYDLLVVGLGPVGDALAALAQVQGLSVLAIDKAPAPFPLPRAAVFDHEIMRIFQMIGVAERILPLCRVPDRYQFHTATGKVLLDFPVDPEGPYGWAETYALHQPAVEAVLRERLVELGVTVRLGTAFERLDQDASGLTAMLRHGGEVETVRVRYLVGCDGSWSPVREALGIGLDDYRFDEPWLVLDTIVEDPRDLPITCQQICDPARPVTYMAMSGQRFRWEFMLRPGETPEEMLDDAKIRTLIAPWGCAERMLIERKAVYRFHGLVADQWRVGRALIAGDAAHQMPPFAGQGMCSGIRDAANLAWKLAAIIHQDADEAILDSYQAEREPHVRAIIETAIAMGKVVCLLDSEAASTRDRDMLARKAAGAQDVSVVYPDLSGGLLSTTPRAGALFPQPVAPDGTRFDTLLGHCVALVGRNLPAVSPTGVRVFDLADTAVEPFAAAIDDWLADIGGAAALIRPDRHVFATGEPGHLINLWIEMTRRRLAA